MSDTKMTPQHSEHHATTTEELIVQYLDGELVRKELEGVLFERLARSEEARMLLREHLMLRGALRSTMEHDTFQLSADLDARTRTRIEDMLKQGANIPGVIKTAPERVAIATNPATRSLRRWGLRPAYAALLLLLTAGTTWYVTRVTTAGHISGQNLAANQATPQTAPMRSTPAEPAPGALSEPSQSVASSIAPASTKSLDKQPRVREVVKYVKVPVEVPADRELAQNTQSSVASAKQQTAEPMDPAGIMDSHRYAKLLNATAKREVIVSGKDRL